MKRSKLLFVSGILSTIYLVYILNHFISGMFTGDGFEFIAAGLASALVTPHALCVGIAVIFNWIGWAMKLRWAALVSGIMYAISILFMFLYAPFVIVQMIMCFVAFSVMKKPSTKLSV